MKDNEKKLLKFKAQEEIKEEVAELKQEINILRRDAEYKEKEKALREKELELDAEKSNLELSKEVAVLKADNAQLEKRLDESPYKQLQEILKALAVKLPTLNITEIHAHKD